jgi:drug/metabolite transporter (DMT)-like permease
MSELYQRNSASASSSSSRSSSNNSSPAGGTIGTSSRSANNQNHHHRTTTNTTTTTAAVQQAAIPGRPQRRRRRQQYYRPLGTAWWGGGRENNGGGALLFPVDILVAVLLWYALGVISIATSKILLSPNNNNSDNNDAFLGVVSSWRPLHPLTLTLQQLSIGTVVLYGLIARNFGRTMTKMASSSSSRLPPLSSSSASYFVTLPRHSIVSRQLTICGVCFTLGFLCTNIAFARSAPSLVETIKAAEPFTSALLAVGYGIERISTPQVMYLSIIMVGVLLSTMVQSHNGSGSDSGTTTTTTSSTTSAGTTSCAIIVMMANLCFSYRGLYQKLLLRQLQQSDHINNNNTINTNNVHHLDDLNLQYQMQSTGIGVLLIPVLVLQGIVPLYNHHLLLLRRQGGSDGDGDGDERSPWTTFFWGGDLDQSSSSSTSSTSSSTFVVPAMVLLIQQMVRYLVIALTNGLCFTFYNLASTYILSRLSVVHHAALNCLRRIFAIVITSLLFQIPLSFTAASGIALAITGFLAYTQSKQQQQQQSQQLLQQQQPTTLFTTGRHNNNNNHGTTGTEHNNNNGIAMTITKPLLLLPR